MKSCGLDHFSPSLRLFSAERLLERRPLVPSRLFPSRLVPARLGPSFFIFSFGFVPISYPFQSAFSYNSPSTLVSSDFFFTAFFNRGFGPEPPTTKGNLEGPGSASDCMTSSTFSVTPSTLHVTSSTSSAALELMVHRDIIDWKPSPSEPNHGPHDALRPVVSFDAFDPFDAFDSFDAFDTFDAFGALDAFDALDPFDASDALEPADPNDSLDPFDAHDACDSAERKVPVESLIVRDSVVWFLRIWQRLTSFQCE